MMVKHRGYTVDDHGNSFLSNSRSLHYLKIVAARRGHHIIIHEEHHWMKNDYDDIVHIGVLYRVHVKDPVTGTWSSPDDQAPSGNSLKTVIQVMTNKMF